MRNVQELDELCVQVGRLREDNAAMMNEVMRLVQRMQNNVNAIERAAVQVIDQAQRQQDQEVVA